LRPLFLLFLALAFLAPVREIRPVQETEPLSDDVDDPALWIHPRNPELSLIVSTVKRPAPEGALAVFTLDGKLVELTNGIDRPNNVDIQGDICVVTERLKRQLRVYRVTENKPHLQLIGAVPVFEGEVGERAAPMGIGLYERPRDKTLFAIVSRKEGPLQNYLWQYELNIAGDRVTGRKSRSFGAFSGVGEIEAVAVDDASGLVYYADEECCVRVYRADPAAAGAAREIRRLAESGFRGNREGIAVTGGYVVVTDQLPEASEYHVFHNGREVWIWRGSASSTDGIEALARPLGSRFPRGLLVVMNSSRRNFQLYNWPM
jgi:3-phytase